MDRMHLVDGFDLQSQRFLDDHIHPASVLDRRIVATEHNEQVPTVVEGCVRVPFWPAAAFGRLILRDQAIRSAVPAADCRGLFAIGR
jgi:hypothetical protein